ncbi:MAG: tetratricopeptide repeat protein [Bacteroidota bacterium]
MIKEIKNIHLYLVGVLVLSIVVFLPAMNGEFLNWDDTTYITGNALVFKDISYSSFKDLYEFNRYISLVLFSFLVQINLFGDSPELFHIINILIHALNVLLIFKLASTLLRSDKTALFIALLFAVFPTRAESVCWIAQRKDLLFTMFFLISALSYIKFLKDKKILWFFIVIISSYLSVMCKLQALAIIPTLILLEYFINGKIQYKSWFLITGIFLIMLIKIGQFKEMALFIITPLLIGFYHDRINKLFHFINFNIRVKKRKHNIRITDLIFYYYFCSIGGTVIYSFITGAIFQDFTEISFYILLQINAVFILYILYYKPRFHITRNKIKFFIILFIIGVLTTGVILFYSNEMLQDGWALFKSNNVFYPFYSLNYYLYRFIFPFNLNAMVPYPESVQSLPLIYTISPIISILVTLCIIVALRKIKDQGLRRNIIFGLLFFLINIALVLHIIPIKGRVIVADRYTYLAYFGLAFSLICLLEFLYHRITHKFTKRSFQILAVAGVLALSLQTYSRSHVYLNDKTFWSDIISKDKDNHYAWYSLGLYYYEKGDYENAIKHYNTAIDLNSNNYEYYANRGGTYTKMQEYEKALKDFNKAISLNPGNHTAYNNRGAIFLKAGKPEKALSDFKKALSLKPGYPEAAKNLEDTKEMLHSVKSDDGKEKPNKALSDYHNEVGMEKVKQGNMKAALKDFEKAVNYDETNTEALKNRGNALASLDRFEEAKADYLKILELSPEDGGAMMNIGNIMHQTGEVGKACQYWEMALEKGFQDARKMIEKYCER